MVTIYDVFVYTVIHLYPSLVPKSINYELFQSILLLFLIVYPIYSIIQSPLNGILFKFIESGSQFKLARIYPIVFLAFCTLLFLLFVMQANRNYVLLIIINACYLFLLLGIKVFVVKKNIVRIGGVNG